MAEQKQDDQLEPTYNSYMREGLPEAMNDRKKWRVRARDIRAGATTW